MSPRPPPVSLAREFRDSSRAGPRVWSLVGLALLLGLWSTKFVWLALALWLVFVFPLAVGGLVRWAAAEIVGRLAAQSLPTMRPPASAPRQERVVTGRVVPP